VFGWGKDETSRQRLCPGCEIVFLRSATIVAARMADDTVRQQQTDAVDAPAAPARARSSFIVGPLHDGFFFIFSPLWAIALGFWVSHGSFWNTRVEFGEYRHTFANLFIGAFIMAHLVLVFFRSHANQNIFKTHPIRFTIVPIALVTAMTASVWVFVTVLVLTTWWDVYHSALQTFGIGRIYDTRAGNDPQVGRSLDRNLNILLYLGPILAGATLMEHVNDFREFDRVGAMFFTAIPAYANANASFFTWLVLLIGIPFLSYYVLAYWILHRGGYHVSWQKVALLVSTGLCSIFAWGFNSFGEAFFIVNFFHALQYFALVWWSEKKNLTAVFHLGGMRWGRQLTFLIFIGLAAVYGVWAETSIGESQFCLAIVNTVAVMHFWYDGFIWSVRRKQV
jgi:hypothetical protein